MRLKPLTLFASLGLALLTACPEDKTPSFPDEDIAVGDGRVGGDEDESSSDCSSHDDCADDELCFERQCVDRDTALDECEDDEDCPDDFICIEQDHCEEE